MWIKLHFNKTVYILLFFGLLFSQPHTSISQTNIQEEKHTVESILSLIHKYGLDTVAIKQQLQSIIQTPFKEGEADLLWGYQMLMADIYSIMHDNTNPYSDHYYQKCLQLAKSTNNIELEFLTYARQGHYYFIYRKISQALPFFLKANYLQPKTDLKKVPALLDHYKFISGFYSHIGNHQRAIEYLKIALPYSLPYSRQRIDILNSIGIYSQLLGQKEQALQYLQKSLKEAQISKDTAWIGILSGNISEYKWKEGKKEEALKLLIQNINSSLEKNERLDYLRSNLVAATYYTELNNWKSAEHHLNNALKMINDKPALLIHKVEVAKILSKISSLKGDIPAENKYLKEYISLKQELDKQSDNEEILKIGWQFESEQYEKSIAENDDKQRSIKRTYSLIGLLVLLGATIIVLLLNRSKNAIKIKHIELNNAKLKLDLEKKAVDQELDSVKNALNEFIKTIKENNVVIANLRKELNNTHTSDDQVRNKVSHELNSMLKSHLMTQERWVNFKKNFDLMYPDYLQNLKHKNPQLTENDLRIMALVKLDLNNRSMADLLGISPEGIKKAKQRLKKKLNTPSSENTEV